MADLSKLSLENLERIQKVLKIVLDELELQGINRLAGNTIPMEKFKKEGFSRDDILIIFNRINKKDNIIHLIEEDFDYTNKGFWPPITEAEKIQLSLEQKAKAERYINFIVKDLSALKKTKKSIDDELKKKAQACDEETKRQFEELDEKQKAFEELGRQISSRIQKDFDVKQYREFIEKIDEQAKPIRKVLKQLDVVYSGSAQNSLNPVLQRLTESIKSIGEQMKRLKPLFEHPEYSKEAFISSDVIRARQGAKTISKLENIEALLQGLLSKDKEKPTQEEVLKLSPELYGVGINFKPLFKKIFDKLRKKNNRTQK